MQSKVSGLAQDKVTSCVNGAGVSRAIRPASRLALQAAVRRCGKVLQYGNAPVSYGLVRVSKNSFSRSSTLTPQPC